MGIFRDTGWERKMPGFDGVIAVVYADVHGFAHPFLVIVENLRVSFVLGVRVCLLRKIFCSFPAR